MILTQYIMQCLAGPNNGTTTVKNERHISGRPVYSTAMECTTKQRQGIVSYIETTSLCGSLTLCQTNSTKTRSRKQMLFKPSGGGSVYDILISKLP